MERRLAAILTADVVGYSGLMSEDEAGTLAALRAHRADVFDPVVAARGGRLVKLMGDGALVEFPSVVAAVEAALEIQRALAATDSPIRLRIGVNLGDVIIDGDDIYGDGVNVAARLETLAEPGGICISSMVQESVGNRIEAEFGDAGEHEVKGIARPIRVWQWPASGATQAPSALPKKPSIAVLPFDNMSDDREQEYFADGMTEDIITELARFSGLFVIARNSAFTYKGKSVKSQEIRRDLGVRYFVKGSVRKAGDRVRVSVQLIDSETGNHLWADRYDRELTDIFQLQDELTQAIVATLPGRLLLAEKDRIRRKPPNPMAAYDYVIAGRIHHHRVTREDNAEAIRLLESAIQLDPEFAEAYAWKACTLGQSLQFGFRDDAAEAEAEAFDLIDKALSLNENDVECHRLLCEVLMEAGRVAEASVHNDRALNMNPNDPRLVAQRGELLTWLGDADAGIEWIERAMRLDPFGAPRRAHLLGRALYSAKRYEAAVAAFKKITSPSYMHLAEAAACHAKIGDKACASELASAVLRLSPDFAVDRYMSTRTYEKPGDAANLAEGLRAAGLPG